MKGILSCLKKHKLQLLFSVLYYGTGSLNLS